MAVIELDRCIDELGFKGVEISTNVNGKDLTRAGAIRPLLCRLVRSSQS
jgi:hypothetical protein